MIWKSYSFENAPGSCYELINLATHQNILQNPPGVIINYLTLSNVFTARRWLLSAAYTDTKLWEARETEPQNLGKNKGQNSKSKQLECVKKKVSGTPSPIVSKDSHTQDFYLI